MSVLNKPQNRSPFSPITRLVSGITANLFATAAPRLQAATTRAACTVRPSNGAAPICEPQCGWLVSLLEFAIQPVLAADSKTAGPLDHMMSDISAFSKNQLNKQSASSLRYPHADRIIAIGDVHGDVDAMREALQISGLIDQHDSWVGGKSVLVQVGDQLDRGNREREIYELLFKLQDTAPQQGGAVHILLGNHELMNIRMDYRYVTKGGFEDFDRDGGVKTVFGRKQRPQIPAETMRTIRALPANMRARAKSLCQGGPLAMELAERAKVSVIVGDNVFVHGGLNTKHLTFGGQDPANAEQTLRALNDGTQSFLRGVGKLPMVLRGGSSPVWLRDYSRPSLRASSEECRMLADTLKLIRAKRMIVGHTPQAEGINSACGGKVWRVDTGMSAAYGGVPEALEISRRGRIRIFSPQGVVQGSARFK